MSCNCKKKTVQEQPSTVKTVENSGTIPPEMVTDSSQEVNDIVNKINAILEPNQQ